MRRTIAILIFLLAISPLSAQNLVANGDFPAGVGSWNPAGTGTFSHSNLLDADGAAPASGSGQLANSSPLAAGSYFVSQCISVTASTGCDFGAAVRFDSDNLQTATGMAHVVVSFSDGANCSGNSLGAASTPFVVSTSTDTWIQAEVPSFLSPATSVSAQLSLWSSKNEASETITVNFDNVAFGLAGILPVELQSFAVE